MIISVNNIRYYIEIRGEREPLLFLHGFTGSTNSWDEIISTLSCDFMCIAIDIIGHGKTEHPIDVTRYNMENVADDLAAILDMLKIEKINVVGYSMGGRLAVAFTVNYPARVSRLILESSSPGLETAQERQNRVQQDERLAQKIENEGIEAFVSYWENIPLFSSQKNLPTKIKEQIREERLRNSKIGLANSLRGMGTGAQLSYWNALKHINTPVLLLCGEYDQKFCQIAKNMAKCFPNAQVSKINGAGHAIHVEQPKFFGTIVSEFVKAQVKG